MTNASYMARLGQSLICNGYKILPIAPGTKKPGRFASSAWADLSNWDRFAARQPTDLELEAWSSWPSCAVGILGGDVAAVDIDIASDAKLAIAIEELARKRLGDTPALRIGKAPKRMLIYKTAAPFKGIKRHPLEILCQGQQFVAYADHPETGQTYAWPQEGLADLDIDSLPVITQDQARSFLDEAYAMLPAELCQQALSAKGPAAQGGEPAAKRSSVQQGTFEAVNTALAWLPNAELDYDSWTRVGMAIKGALGEEGRDLFLAWSQQAAKDVPDATLKAWESYKPNSIGAGTLYHLAMERGWQPAAGLVLNGSQPKDTVHPAAGLLTGLQVDDFVSEQGEGSESSSAQSIAPPPNLSRLDGALEMMVDHILASAIRPQPWLAVGAALTALGTIMGRKVSSETDLRTNLYVVGLAESGGGKDHARKAIKEIFRQCGFAEKLGGERLASGAGLLTALQREPAALFQIDEFGKFMSHVVDKHRAPKHLAEIWDLFTELATSASTTFMGAEYADQRLRPRQDIIQPCASIHGVSAPGPFWDSLTTGALQDGSLTRFLVFRSEDDIPDRNLAPKKVSEVPAALITRLQAINEAGLQGKGNLVGLLGDAIMPKPETVAMSPDAREVFDEIDKDLTGRQRAAIGSDQGPVLARYWENAAKVAVIKAVSADPYTPEVRLCDALWARDLVEHCVSTLLQLSERHIADSKTEKHHKKVLEIIREAGMSGISRRTLSRKTQFLDLRSRNEIIQTLEESGQVFKQAHYTKGRNAEVYKARR